MCNRPVEVTLKSYSSNNEQETSIGKINQFYPAQSSHSFPSLLINLVCFWLIISDTPVEVNTDHTVQYFT